MGKLGPTQTPVGKARKTTTEKGNFHGAHVIELQSAKLAFIIIKANMQFRFSLAGK